MEATLIILAVLAGLIFFWTASMRDHERAVAATRAACERMGVQFLDETVSLDKLRLGRHPNGRMTFRRTFRFEFSISGERRFNGYVRILGGRIEALHLETDEGAVVEGEAREE